MMKDTPNGQTHHAMCWKDHHECAQDRINRSLFLIKQVKIKYGSCHEEKCPTRATLNSIVDILEGGGPY